MLDFCRSRYVFTIFPLNLLLKTPTIVVTKIHFYNKYTFTYEYQGIFPCYERHPHRLNIEGPKLKCCVPPNTNNYNPVEHSILVYQRYLFTQRVIDLQQSILKSLVLSTFSRLSLRVWVLVLLIFWHLTIPCIFSLKK